MKSITIGDQVLIYGNLMTVIGLEPTQTAAGSRTVAHCRDEEAFATRQQAIDEIAALREEQERATEAFRATAEERDATAVGSAEWRALDEKLEDVKLAEAVAHRKAAKRIRELSAVAGQGLARFKLRVDLLSWWDARGVWVSDGRILSDAQHEAFAGKGRKVPADRQRAALDLLEKGA